MVGFIKQTLKCDGTEAERRTVVQLSFQLSERQKKHHIWYWTIDEGSKQVEMAKNSCAA